MHRRPLAGGGEESMDNRIKNMMRPWVRSRRLSAHKYTSTSADVPELKLPDPDSQLVAKPVDYDTGSGVLPKGLHP